MDPSTRFVRSPAATIKQVGDGIAVYVREQRALHVPNDTARVLIARLEQPATFDELAAMLVELTGAESERVAADLEEALSELVALAIVEPCP